MIENHKVQDRRKLKRSRAWWRVLAVISISILVIIFIGKFDGFDERPHIAALDVENIIVDDQDRLELIKEIASDPSAKALIVYINSPGGTVVGGESLYFALRNVAKKKPVVAVMRELATSAGYMIALGADHIIARESSITGSIGVLMQSTDLTGLLDKLGIKPESVKSSPLKAQPNPLEPLSDDARRVVREIVRDMQDMFAGLVKDRRNLGDENARQVSNGRIFTGRQALSNGLIDSIGGEDEAILWLKREKYLSDDLPVVQISAHHDGRTLREILEYLFGITMFSERLRLDGLISLWHPNIR